MLFTGNSQTNPITVLPVYMSKQMRLPRSPHLDYTTSILYRTAAFDPNTGRHVVVYEADNTYQEVHLTKLKLQWLTPPASYAGYGSLAQLTYGQGAVGTAAGNGHAAQVGFASRLHFANRSEAILGVMHALKNNHCVLRRQLRRRHQGTAGHAETSCSTQ